MQKIMNKKILIPGGLVFIILALVFSLKACGKSSKYNYEFQKASVGPVQKTISATGVLEVDGVRPVLCKLNGIMENVKVVPEQKIKKGQLLATIDTSEIDQKLLRLATKLESSQLQLISERKLYQGKKNMYKENLISKKGLEQAELSYKTSINHHKLNRIDYNQCLRQKRNARILAPINGVVLSVKTTVNSPVRVNHTIFVIAPDLAKMLLKINIDESDIGNVKKNQAVTFNVSAYPVQKFKGVIKLVSINPIKSGGLVTYQSEVECDNSEFLLKPGMTATSTIIVAQKKKALRVPNQAFIVSPDYAEYRADGKYLWKKSKKIINKLPLKQFKVETGLAGDMFTEIVKNVKKGDEILVKIEEADE